ncbi:Immunoglobulin subtype isoform 2 [Schistosoma japonicum]|uniref:Immunoglobulin subtype isoform 2 n=1 Tax=Schistosoma japonicum TaxID=6182 RepID=A0A4Z2DGM1_SCHJA|nr:Immunoglobulin subtype isoform 2 [Schistosoma japonicum]
MVLRIYEEYAFKLLQFYLFCTVCIRTNQHHHYDSQKEIILHKTMEFIPYWIFNLPLLCGNQIQHNYNRSLHNNDKREQQNKTNISQTNKQYQNKEYQRYKKPAQFDYLSSVATFDTRQIYLNDNLPTSTINLLSSKYSKNETHEKHPSKSYHQLNNLTFNYLINKTSVLKALNGYAVHQDCYLNTDGRQEIPCIINPYPLYNLIRKFPNMDAYKLFHDSTINLFQPFNNKQESIEMTLTYEAGENAYLPCHTLGAEESETIIWEKGQNPLFVSTVSFVQDTRFRLNITDENYLNNEIPHFNIKTKYSHEFNKQSTLKEKHLSSSNYLNTYNVRNNWKYRRWDLIIDFITQKDSDVYTCMLMGRTSQMIRYHVIVNESAARISYSRKRLITISSPSLITIGSSFNLTCSICVTKDKSFNIAVDWFRPTYSVETSPNRPITLFNSQKLNNILSLQSDLSIYNSKQTNVSSIIGEFAYSFQQITSRSSMGITIYKQVSGELNYNYRSEVLLTVQSASENDGGLYECRVYEAVNYGHEQIVDRAFLDIIIRKRYPHNSFEQIKLNTKLRKLLSTFWKLNPTSQNDDNFHDEHTQNDVASKGRAKYRIQNISKTKARHLNT